ncbi:MAG: hypothetical protein J6Y20_11590 [Lachnospiraceae bacterium]|nr:hypothetical protein [Lachnospiraceae bacterium]
MANEMPITRGTTPVIAYKFKIVNPEDIEAAYLTIEQSGGVAVEKDLSEATVETDRLVWHLTQEETLRFRAKPTQAKYPPVKMQLRYRLKDGTAHATVISEHQPFPVMKDGEI